MHFISNFCHFCCSQINTLTHFFHYYYLFIQLYWRENLIIYLAFAMHLVSLYISPFVHYSNILHYIYASLSFHNKHQYISHVDKQSTPNLNFADVFISMSNKFLDSTATPSGLLLTLVLLFYTALKNALIAEFLRVMSISFFLVYSIQTRWGAAPSLICCLIY